MDPVIVDDVISIFRDSSVDYASNIQPPSFPDGLDVEVFSTVALKQAHLAAVDNSDKEHVTPVLRRLDASRRKICSIPMINHI